MIEPIGEGAEISLASETIAEVLRGVFQTSWFNTLFADMKWLDYGRSPYPMGMTDKEKGVTVWFGGKLTHFTVELSGRGVDFADKHIGINNLICVVRERVTRIDLAVDMLTDVTPEAFVDAGHSSRTKTKAVMTSQSGDTVYVGSTRSEHYARVYRYAHPHPRSPFLRVEHVFRREQARSVASVLCSGSLRDAVASCRDLYGWQHQLSLTWKGKTADLAVPRPERNGGKTLYWLISQVVPSFRRLVQEGIIDDPVRFCEMYFLSDHFNKD